MKPRYSFLALSLALSPTLAHGDFSLQFAVKWEPLRYILPQVDTVHPANTSPASPSDPSLAGQSGTAVLPSSSSYNAFQRRDLNALLGLGFTDKLTLQIGFDLARASLSHTDAEASAVNRTFTTFGFSLGVKFNFTAPRREKISPYLYGDFFKYFSAINDDRPGNLSQSEVEFSAGLTSPLGFRLGFGIEYYFTESFGLGAEIAGLQLAYSSGSMRRTDAGTAVNHEQSLTSVAYYTALTLTFRFPHLIRYGRTRYRDRDEGFDRDRE
jgi:hypothetical protein